MNKLTIVIGRSAAGKSTMVKGLVEDGYHILQSCTTREKRPGEDNSEYLFLSKEDYEQQDILAQFMVNDTWKYGITKEQFFAHKNQVISVISENYARAIKYAAEVLNINVEVEYLNVDRKTRYNRMIERGDSEESIKKRFEIEDSEGPYKYDL